MYFQTIRAGQNRILGQLFKLDRSGLLRMSPGLLNFVSYRYTGNQIKFTPYVRPPPMDHDYKNMAVKRPMSPHLTVYAPTVPSMTSIAQRATGCVLTFYAFSLAVGALFFSNGVESYVSMIQSLGLGYISTVVIKLILGFPFAYHYFNAIRYVIWNMAKMLDMKSVYQTASQAAIAAVVLAFLFALI
ncbi:succinate dehydrogenase cytochrome b560 subunit, mitochondrial-like [Spodoptera frugiperda]|uniref:Succinate dehydrogenase cytochrome b560 subunit, mitochondrial-like n=1 Tax=Spodoptera frugiperda TaxID=7108 RepID=A0A9R0CY18_SPOFR|nr:succinate dehydrogenase cytochrome b560 subunit, mitochondrial-like [Spodoptera frugiperda]